MSTLQQIRDEVNALSSQQNDGWELRRSLTPLLDQLEDEMSNGGSIPDPVTTPLNIAVTDPAVVSETVTLPVGQSAAGTLAVQVMGEGGVQPVFTLDPYGVLTVNADPVDPTNGGGAFIANDQEGNTVHFIGADAGDGLGTGLLSFFGAPTLGQRVVPLTTPSVQDVIDALVSLGLVAQHD